MSRPPQAASMTTPLKLFVVSGVMKVNGVPQKQYKEAEDPMFMCSFKTYGGTEKLVNGVQLIEDTANIVTWYRPDITSGCKVERLTDGANFEIINEPENIEQRNQFLSFKIRRLKGGV